MSNHFHLPAEVPHRQTWLQRFDGPEGEAKLLEHLSGNHVVESSSRGRLKLTRG